MSGGKSYATDVVTRHAHVARRAGNRTCMSSLVPQQCFLSISFFRSTVAIMETATEWSCDKTLRLIALFEQRPILWDSRFKDYKNRDKRHDAIVELAAYFHVEKNEIMRKLRNLQDQFYRNLKKEKLLRTYHGESNTEHCSKWFAYQALRFLEKNKRNQIAAGGKTPAVKRRQKSTQRARLTRADKSRHLVETDRRNSEYQAKLPSVRISLAKITVKNSDKKDIIPPDVIKCPANDATTDFLYVDEKQQNNLDSQIEILDEKPIGVTSQYPIEFAEKVNDESQRQSPFRQRSADFEGTPKTTENSSLSTREQQNLEVIPEKAITPTPTIDFLLTEAKTHDSYNPELNFYRGLIPDIMKLSDRRRRQFKEVVLCTLNKLLDEDEKDRAERGSTRNQDRS